MIVKHAFVAAGRAAAAAVALALVSGCGALVPGDDTRSDARDHDAEVTAKFRQPEVLIAEHDQIDGEVRELYAIDARLAWMIVQMARERRPTPLDQAFGVLDDAVRDFEHNMDDLIEGSAPRHAAFVGLALAFNRLDGASDEFAGLDPEKLPPPFRGEYKITQADLAVSVHDLTGLVKK